MAYEIQGFKGNFIAGEDLSTKQYVFVKLSAANTVVACTAADDIPMGVLQNAPYSGLAAEVMVSGLTKVKSNTALTVGWFVGPAATTGKAERKIIGTATTEYAVGTVVEATTGSSGIATITLNCFNPPRAK